MNDQKVDINEENILDYSPKLLKILLKDRTTNKNIIWGTNDYQKHGEKYKAYCEIDSNSITGKYNNLIQPRTTKTHSKKNNRTREKAEVFTPSWVCNVQNNLVDQQWFGEKEIFNEEIYQGWKVNLQKIKFPFEKEVTWEDYVNAIRLEITCGEAPYLTSRYDTVSGKRIALKSRIGLLDRKLRIINENVENEQVWFIWVERAYKSIYGYECQGDNLLLARENLLFTFIDNMIYKFHTEPTSSALNKIATIISWNIWQMDGLTNAVPLQEKKFYTIQGSLFDYMETEILEYKTKYQLCNIMNWESKEIISYAGIIKGER